jgi:hypothetical protein
LFIRWKQWNLLAFAAAVGGAMVRFGVRLIPRTHLLPPICLSIAVINLARNSQQNTFFKELRDQNP